MKATMHIPDAVWREAERLYNEAQVRALAESGAETPPWDRVPAWAQIACVRIAARLMGQAEPLTPLIEEPGAATIQAGALKRGFKGAVEDHFNTAALKEEA